MSRSVLLIVGAALLAGVIAVLAFDMAGSGDASPPKPDETAPVEVANEPEGNGPVVYSLEGELAQALDFISRGRFNDARAAIALYQRNRQGCIPCEFLLGLSYHKEKRYEQARPYFERSLEMQPRYASARYFYGWCLYYLGELDASRQAFEAHLELDPLEGDSEYALGLIAMDEGNLEDAEARFRKAIDLQHNNPRRLREVAKAHARLGDVFALQDDLEEAKKELHQATVLWPGHYEAFFKLARVLYRLGEDEAAEAAMEQYEIGKQRVEGALPTPQPAEREDAP